MKIACVEIASSIRTFQCRRDITVAHSLLKALQHPEATVGKKKTLAGHLKIKTA